MEIVLWCAIFIISLLWGLHESNRVFMDKTNSAKVECFVIALSAWTYFSLCLAAITEVCGEHTIYTTVSILQLVAFHGIKHYLYGKIQRNNQRQKELKFIRIVPKL